MNNGRCNAKAVDTAMGYSRNGKQQIEILLEAVDGDSAGERISYIGSFSGGAAQYALEAMRACGWESGRPVVAENFPNVVPIEVHEEEYDGKTRQKVRIFTPRKTLVTKIENRMSPIDADAFLASITGTAPSTVAPHVPADEHAATPDPEDDLLF